MFENQKTMICQKCLFQYLRISHIFPLGGTTLDFKNEVHVFDISRQEWHMGPTVETVNSNDAILIKHSASYVEENGNILVVGGGKLRNCCRNSRSFENLALANFCCRNTVFFVWIFL